jgi:hypothetical protein
MLSDEVWQVIKDHLAKDGFVCDNSVKKLVEENAEITPFNGGVFITVGNEFDVFVVPEKRGKWNIRGEITRFLAKMAEKHDIAIVRINEDNVKSLRLAKFFGFDEIERKDGVIKLERKLWAELSEV